VGEVEHPVPYPNEEEKEEASPSVIERGDASQKASVRSKPSSGVLVWQGAKKKRGCPPWSPPCVESAKFISPFVYAEITKLTALVNPVLAAKTCPPELPSVLALLLVQSPPDVDRVWRWNFVAAGLRRAGEYYRDMFVLCQEFVDEDDRLKMSFRESIDLFRFARLFDPHQGLKLLTSSEFSFDDWKPTVIKVVGEDLWAQMRGDLHASIGVYRGFLENQPPILLNGIRRMVQT
jgi:hypothetical protein